MTRIAAGQGMRRACTRLAVLEVAELIVDGVGGLEPVVRVSLAIVDALHPVLVVGVHLAIGRLLAGHRTGRRLGRVASVWCRPLDARNFRGVIAHGTPVDHIPD